MILFPYAKDVDYKDNKLDLTLEIFDSNKRTELALSIHIDEEISEIIERLLEDGEYDEL